MVESYQTGFSPSVDKASDTLETNGNPCVGCGWCCLDYPCDQSIHRHGYTDRCPELFWSAEKARYLCAMAMDMNDGAYIRKVQRMGEGCCAPSNRWRNAVRQRD